MVLKWIALFVIGLSFSQVYGDWDVTERNETKEYFKAPQLVLRPDIYGNFWLDVYNPEGMTNFVQDSKAKIGNPSCTLEGGNLLKPKGSIVTLEYKSMTAITSEDVDLSITKASYKAIVESQGYLQCVAETKDHGSVASSRKLYRFSDHSFAMNVIYNCTKTNCYDIKSLTKRLEKSFDNHTDKSLLLLSNIAVIPVRNITAEDGHAILYRIDITQSEPLQLKVQLARKTQEDQKDDTDLINFIKDVVNNHFTDQEISSGVCDFIRSTKYCPALQIEGLSWPMTGIGLKAATEQLCVGSNGGPIILECLGDFTIGAFWNAVPRLQMSLTPEAEALFQRFGQPRANQMLEYTEIPKCEPTTARMNNLYQLSRNETLNKVTPNDNIKKLELALAHDEKETNPLTKVEINLVAEALSNFSPNVIDIADISAIANITNILMKMPGHDEENDGIDLKIELKGSQEASNSSNRILDSLDRVLNKAVINGSSELIITEKFVTLIMEISSSTELNRIRGLAAIKTIDSEIKSFNSKNVVLLTVNDTLEDVLNMNVSMAVMVPPELYENAKGRPRRLVINLFLEDSLFGSQHTVGKTNMVLSVTLNGERYQSLATPLILLFESDPQNRYTQENSYSKSPCVFWDFQADHNNGGWSNYGCELAKPRKSIQQNLDVCLCSHLTHFAELLRDHPADIISTTDKIALDMITLVGCSLSLIGLLAIGVTAVVFPSWRKGASKKVQLGLSASLLIMMTSFLIVSFSKGQYGYEGMMESALCRVAGFLLHYSVLSSFCWMIVAAWGQYLRLTKPLVSLNRQPHFILKSSLFAWGLPLVPCIIVMAVDYQTYGPPNCYPTGNILYVSVFLPVVLAVALNGILFMLILFSIYNCCGLGMGLVQLRNNQNKRRIAFRKLATAMFLFSLIGMSWIFGIMNMRYLFCITASTQGFAVFIFFVVLDKSTRGKWCNLAEPKKEVLNLNSFSNSADFIRRMSRQSRAHSRYASTRVSTLSDSR